MEGSDPSNETKSAYDRCTEGFTKCVIERGAERSQPWTGEKDMCVTDKRYVCD